MARYVTVQAAAETVRVGDLVFGGGYTGSKFDKVVAVEGGVIGETMTLVKLSFERFSVVFAEDDLLTVGRKSNED